MERAKNPWGINHEKRMEWAEGLRVKTVEENPDPDVLYWVGCAASYDPQSQKTARAFVQLLDHAGVNFAVLGKKECCTGDSARRAGDEFLYQQLAGQNVSTLNQVKPKLIVATCPHCMNAIGKEYRQLGGEYKVMHHTEYLEMLVTQGKLPADAASATVAFHDPCYLGRHNGVYDAPRNVLRVLSNNVVELGRNRENSFCCGAGGAQFWKEEEPGTERISDNRYREAQQALAGAENKVLAVGCPFCKSMLESTPGRVDTDAIAVKDVAELLLERVMVKLGKVAAIAPASPPEPTSLSTPVAVASTTAEVEEANVAQQKIEVAKVEPLPALDAAPNAFPATPPAAGRKKWLPKSPAPKDASPTPQPTPVPLDVAENKEAQQSSATDTVSNSSSAAQPGEQAPPKRKTWTPTASAAKQEPPKPSDEKPADA
jgi:heterodisulfide reductase subunit B